MYVCELLHIHVHETGVLLDFLRGGNVSGVYMYMYIETCNDSCTKVLGILFPVSLPLSSCVADIFLSFSYFSGLGNNCCPKLVISILVPVYLNWYPHVQCARGINQDFMDLVVVARVLASHPCHPNKVGLLAHTVDYTQHSAQLSIELYLYPVATWLSW